MTRYSMFALLRNMWYGEVENEAFVTMWQQEAAAECTVTFMRERKRDGMLEVFVVGERAALVDAIARTSGDREVAEAVVAMGAEEVRV